MDCVKHRHITNHNSRQYDYHRINSNSFHLQNFPIFDRLRFHQAQKKPGCQKDESITGIDEESSARYEK